MHFVLGLLMIVSASAWADFVTVGLCTDMSWGDQFRIEYSPGTSDGQFVSEIPDPQNPQSTVEVREPIKVEIDGKGGYRAHFLTDSLINLGLRMVEIVIPATGEALISNPSGRTYSCSKICSSPHSS